jgi:hypothetical protein
MSDLNYIKSKSIPNGTTFVALYEDGSGARLFMITDEGELLEETGDAVSYAPDTHLIKEGFAYWIKLPDSFQLHFQQVEERP